MRRVLAVLPLLLLVSCASLGLAPAQNFSSRLAYGFSNYTAVNNTITQSLDAKRITSADAVEFRAVANDARKILNAAKLAYEAGDLKDAANRLSLALKALDALAVYMDKREQS
jgi:hypothetical protein